MTSEAHALCRLGAGSFAAVFTWQSRNGIAAKRVADLARGGEMQQEYDDLLRVHAACRGLRVHVPRPIRLFATFEAFKVATGLVGDLEQPLDAAGVFLMERAWPLPPRLAAAVRGATFPVTHADDARSFLARVYLGGARARGAAASPPQRDGLARRTGRWTLPTWRAWGSTCPRWRRRWAAR